MIQIRNQQCEFLQLSAGQRLTIEQASTLMADDELVGGFSYPIRFPLNENNNRFLAFGYRPDNYNPKMELPVQVTLEGHLYRQCLLSYRVADSQGDGFLKIDSGELADNWKKQTLQDIFTDEVDLGITNGVNLGPVMKQWATIEPGINPCTFFPIYNPGFMEPEYPVPLQLYMNEYGPDANGIDTFLVDTATRKGRHAVPQFYLSWVLQKIMGKVGYRVDGDWLAGDEARRLTILNTTSIVSGSRLNAPFRFQAGLHLPEMSVGDFVKAIRQRYGLSLVFNANLKTCSIRSYQSLSRRGKVIDLSTYQLGGYSIDPPTANGFKILDYVDEKDGLFRDASNEVIQPEPILVGKGLTEISLKVGAPKMHRVGSPWVGYGNWYVPQINQPGNITDTVYQDSERFVKDGKRPNPAGLRLLSYQGLQEDSYGKLYPLATSDGLNTLQQRICQPTTLLGNNGLYQRSLRSYYHFRDNTRKVTANLLLPVSVLNQTNLDERIGLRMNDDVLSSFLPSKLQLEAPALDGLLKVRLELQTIPPAPATLADTGYQKPVQSVVWVSLEMSAGAFTTETDSAGTTTRQMGTLILRFYSDAAMTTPATVEDLIVNLELTSTDLFGGTKTTVSPQICNGSTFSPPEAVIFYKYVNSTGHVEDEFNASYALVFGEGYNIL